MKRFIAFFFLTSLAVVSVQAAGRAQLICDGKTFKGWEGDTNKTWRIEEGAFVGGSLGETVPHNEFLCTRRSYTNFVLRVKFKLTGKDGFINGGVQFGILGFQIHGGGKAEAWYKQITIEELP